MRRIIWSGPAQRDLLAIASYFDQIAPDLGSTMLERIERAPLPLLDFPDLGEVMARRNTRKWVVRKTPFLLIYGVAAEDIEIKRVRHEREDWRPLA